MNAALAVFIRLPSLLPSRQVTNDMIESSEIKRTLDPLLAWKKGDQDLNLPPHIGPCGGGVSVPFHTTHNPVFRKSRGGGC